MKSVDYFKDNYNSISTVLFVLSILVSQLFSTPDYDWTKNTISDLGSQSHHRKQIMQIGFLTFSLTLTSGILLTGLTWRGSPIFIYALCVGFTGIFCTKPFFNIDDYSVSQANIHSIFAQIAGISFTIGILLQLLLAKSNGEKMIHFIFFVLVIGSSISFGLVKNYQGIAQRLLYMISFIWLIKFYKA